MDTKTKLHQWMKKMGYDGKFPNNIENICNPSTAFIWEQIIQNVRPKQEVEMCHRNIIMNRLKVKSLKDQDEFPYPIEEIENYRRRIKTTNEVTILKNKIQEKENELDKLTKDNNVKYVTIENLKQKIKEYDERAFLLETKSKMLENEIAQAEDVLVHAKNLTPVELEENPDTVTITETLKKCSAKLEKLMAEMSQNSNSASYLTGASILSSIQKTRRKCMTSHRKQKICTEKKLLSVRKKGTHSKVAKALYLEDRHSKPEYSRCLSEIKPHDNILSVSSSCSSKMKCESNTLSVDNIHMNRDEMKEAKDTENKENKRESLGILPDACLDAIDNNMLLQDVVFKTPEKEQSVFDLLRVQNSIQKRQTPMITITSDEKNKETAYERVYKDEFVAENIKNLLHKHNRLVIWNCIETLCDDLLCETRNVVMQFMTSTNSKRKVNESDIAKLHFVHVKTELTTIKSKIINADLHQKLEKAKKQVLKALSSHPLLKDNQGDIQRILELQIQETKLDAAIHCMKREINSSRKLENSSELQVIKNKIDKTKLEICSRLNIIQEYMEEISKVFLSISRVRDDTVCLVRRLNTFISDMHWALPLTENLHSKEIEVFSMFPMEYNRRFTFTDPKTFYWSICTNSFPSYLDMDINDLNMAVALLESPFSPPEVMIVNILRAKLKLSALKSLQNLPLETEYKKYSIDDLRKQESYMQYALDKLNGLLHSPVNAKVLSSVSKMREVMDLWLEMPFRNFISPKRLVNEKDYSYYENVFNTFFNAL